jgi:hypothetical protein
VFIGPARAQAVTDSFEWKREDIATHGPKSAA